MPMIMILLTVVEVGGDPGERRRPPRTLVTIVMIGTMDIPRNWDKDLLRIDVYSRRPM